MAWAIPFWLIAATSVFMLLWLAVLSVVDLETGVWVFLGGCGCLVITALAFTARGGVTLR